MDDNDELVCVCTFSERTEAELVKSYLEAYGIEVMLKADDVGGLFTHMTANVGHPCILVRAQDAARAAKLIEEAEKKARDEE